MGKPGAVSLATHGVEVLGGMDRRGASRVPDACRIVREDTRRPVSAGFMRGLIRGVFALRDEV